MGLLHSAFLFDYRRFRKEILDITCELDKGNYSPVYARAKLAVQGIEADNWILNLQGTTLSPSLLEAEAHAKPDEPDNIGYCLLVILSKYLQDSSASLAGNWGVLREVLRKVGWRYEDTRLLTEGMPTEVLLKPDIKFNQRSHLRMTDPYWRWMIPTQAHRSGWLSVGEIQRLRCLLLDTEKKLEQFDFACYPRIDTTNPSVIREFQRYLQSAHENALALLLAAEKSNMGLYMIIS